jgi:chitosanase
MGRQFVAGGLAVAAVLSIGSPAPTDAPPDGWLNADQRRRADQLVSAFENSTTDIDYAYAENLGDGRGVTAGRAGFTTATCDALEVITVYGERAGDNVLTPFLPELERLCEQESDDASGLPEASYTAAWAGAAEDPEFRLAQDEVVDRFYYEPAMEAADEIGLETALARAELYDTAIQHGDGDDADGLRAVIERTNQRVGLPSEVGEDVWLDAFFDVRIDDLTNPANTDTADEWRESIDRVECMRRIAATGNVDLNGPITFTVYGDEFEID